VKQRLHARFTAFKNYFRQEIRTDGIVKDGKTAKAPRLEIFYGLCGLNLEDRAAELRKLTKDSKFIYPNPNVCCPTSVFLMFQTRKERFFHGAILNGCRDLLFRGANGLGFKRNAAGHMMNECIPKGIIAWVCVIVCRPFQTLVLMLQIEWALKEYDIEGRSLELREFRPSTMKEAFEFYIESMEKLNCRKFTEAVLGGRDGLTRRRPPLPPGKDEDEDEDDGEVDDDGGIGEHDE
jgi:hypothetical protein